MKSKRLIGYLMLNAVVSATATLGSLWVWDRARPTLPAPVPTSVVATQPAFGPVETSVAGGAPAQATPTPTVYVVQPGDTLGSIAQNYDLTVQEIMDANGLTDPNRLSVGQELVIPVTPVPLATAEPATPGVLPTNASEPPRPTATRDPSVALPRLTIREVRSPGVPAEETLVIVNDGGPVDLLGWSLRDESGHLYVFPSLVLFEDGAINLHTAAGSDSVTDLYWGQAEPVWAPGKSVLLSDASGNLHARFTVP